MSRAKSRCRFGKVKRGPRKGRCRVKRPAAAPCRGKKGVAYRQCRHEVSMAHARKLLR